VTCVISVLQFEAAFVAKEIFVRFSRWFVNVNRISWLEVKLWQKMKGCKRLLLFCPWSFALLVRIGNIHQPILLITCASRCAVTHLRCWKANLRNWALDLQCMWGSGGVVGAFLWLVVFTPSSCYPQYYLYSRFGGPQSRYGQKTAEISCPLPEIGHQFVSRPSP
jgi:hypothetical protein